MCLAPRGMGCVPARRRSAMLLCTKVRLQISVAEAEAPEFMQGKCCGLYDWWVMRVRAGERWLGWREAKAILESSAILEASKEIDPALRFVNGKRLQEVYLRLDQAMMDVFRRCQAETGEKP